MRSRPLAGTLAALVALAAGCGSGAGGSEDGSGEVTVGVTGSLSDAALYIAQDMGYFKDQNLKVKFQSFPDATKMLPAIATDRIQVTRSAQSAGLFNSLSQAVELKLVADGGHLEEGFGYVGIVVRKDLADQLRQPSDLKGRTVAVAATGGTSDILLERLLRRDGLDLEDVELKPLPLPEQLSAFANDSIDAAVMVEPIMTQAIGEDLGVKRWPGEEVYPDMQSALLTYSTAFAEDRETADAFMDAYLKALGDYNAAFGPERKGRDGIVRIMTKYTALKDPAAYEKIAPVGLNEDGSINVENLSDDLRYYTDKGLVEDPPDLGEVVDKSYLERASKAE